MSTTSVNVLGYTGRNKEFIVKTFTADLRSSTPKNYDTQQSTGPFEYLLAGLAGCINALGQDIAIKAGIDLKSLQVEITGKLNNAGTAKQQGFTGITILLKPTTRASLFTLQEWIKNIQQQSPVFTGLLSNAAVDLILYKEYQYS